MNPIKIFYAVFSFLILSSEINAQSVFASGNWFKISVAKEGIYCLTHSDLVALGINPSAIDPRNISMYGNKSGMISVNNNVPHPGDPKELAIFIKGESDGVFDAGDSIFFYGQSPVEKIVDQNTKRYSHVTNIYSDSTFCFLTVKSVPGKRISTISNLPTYTHTATTYDDFEFHELDSVNFLHSGKEWFGETFTSGNPLSLSFDVSQATTDSLFINAHFAARALIGGSSIRLSLNGQLLASTFFSNVGTSIQDNYANLFPVNLKLIGPVLNGLLEFQLLSPDPMGICWLNYFEINLRRNLFLFKPQQIFCNTQTVAAGNITRFTVSNASPSIVIWDITDPLNVAGQQFNINGSSIEFNANSDSAHTYIAFEGNSCLRPVLIGAIPNQDLHSISQANYIIVTTDHFLGEANSLANFHFIHDGLTSAVVTTNQIYNEYSTGLQDPVAIRDFIRQVYFRSGAINDSLKYVLLFGGGSYDYKNRVQGNTNFVPTYQSSGSINLTQTYCSDDFFAMLDSSDTDFGSPPKVGIGRIPVTNSNQATAVTKITNYSAGNSPAMWRKAITVVADDEDLNTHMRQMDTLATRLENLTCDFDIYKIYLDAYVKDFTTTPPSYPGVNQDLKNDILKGRLIVEYAGHGNPNQWASENVLDLQFLDSINNPNLPLFISATSNFNKFDDPLDTCGGQIITTTIDGTGIASISHSRLSFSSSNFNFNQNLNKHLFEKENNQYLRLGDIFRRTKSDSYIDPYTSGICLLGDPALRLNYPENIVVTNAINAVPVTTSPDTLIPGQALRIEGEIQDVSGNIMSGFNGSVNILVFNAKTLHHTLANNPNSTVMPFYEWDDTLIYATVSVSNGIFDSTFNLPFSVDSGINFGKISYYAFNNTVDASGCYQNLVFKNLTSGVIEIDGVRISLYPNPASDKVEISIEGIFVNNFEMNIYGVDGKLIKKSKLNSNNSLIDLNEIASGSYVYEVHSEDYRFIKRGKFLVN